MKKYCYITNDGENYSEHEITQGMRLCDIKGRKGDTVCALSNGSIVSLAYVPEAGDKIQFLAPNDDECASRVFLRGASFLLYCAAKELFPKRALLIDHMLCGGAYCELGEISGADIKALEKKMYEYISEDEDFVLLRMPLQKAKKVMLEHGLYKKEELASFGQATFYDLYEFNGLINSFYGVMPKSSGYLKEVRLFDYSEGFILKYPAPFRQAHKAICDEPKYAAVFSQAEKWAGVLSASYISDINKMSKNNKIEEFIQINEALHEKTIAQIAKKITCKSNVRVVLIAGPTSSGKTTFAKRLLTHIRVLGKKCRAISIDDYYKDRAMVEKDSNGDCDFESLSAIDIKKFNEDLNLLLSGKTAYMPKYDFMTGNREKTSPLRIDGDILVIEGIHGLNDELTKLIPAAEKFKIFISPLTTLNLDEHNVVIPEDLRLLRRLVRDKRTRGFSFEQTFSIWDSVRIGEYRHILPYQKTADIMFNSTLLYEPLILKKYCYNELKQMASKSENYSKAENLVMLLDYFLSLEQDSAVPKNSIIREFIG